MWTKTINFLKDHLSPDIAEKYGALPEAAAQPAEVAGQREETEREAGASKVETVERGEVDTAKHEDTEQAKLSDSAVADGGTIPDLEGVEQFKEEKETESKQ